MAIIFTERFTCRTHVEDTDLAEVRARLQGCHHRLAVVGHHLQPAPIHYVHLLADLPCLVVCGRWERGVLHITRRFACGSMHQQQQCTGRSSVRPSYSSRVPYSSRVKLVQTITSRERNVGAHQPPTIRAWVYSFGNIPNALRTLRANMWKPVSVSQHVTEEVWWVLAELFPPGSFPHQGCLKI